MRRYLFPLILGLAGCSILIGLGLWQMQRLHWKQAMLARIEARLAAAPEGLPERGTPERKYTPVKVEGRTTGQEVLVLTGRKGQGPGYEVISAFEAEGRRILIDRGFVPDPERTTPRPGVALKVTGNLHWPEEADLYTPPPDSKTGIWFARDVPAMAAALQAEPILIVARRVEGEMQGVEPVPLGTEGIPNDHLGYALTWFSLAAVWAGMTAFLFWRIRRQQT
ncbi:SURF1 family protein [Paenirhodobacter sp.]|uniref:SURF1 family protein n=1 Tax=Paenirhodobacter sp. TaxID=1965326 RepID=UPI003B5104BB